MALTVSVGMAMVGANPATSAAIGDGAAVERVQVQEAAIAGKGKIKVRITGLLPSVMKPEGVLKGQGLTKRVTKEKFSVKVKPGRYTLILKPTKSTSPLGRLKRGATAYPEAKKFRVRVRKGRVSLLEASYNAVLARNAVRAPARVKKVVGDPANPTAVVVKSSKKYVKGGYLASGPTKSLPKGVASKIIKVRKRGTTMTLSLRSVQVTEIVPVLDLESTSKRPRDGRQSSPSSRSSLSSLSSLRRLGGSMECTIEIGDPLTYVDPSLNSISWNTFYPAYFAAEVGLEVSVGFSPFPAGREFTCASAASLSVPFSVPAGALVIPAFLGGSLEGSVAVANAGAAQGGFQQAVQFTAGVDTRNDEGTEFYTLPPEPVRNDPTPLDIRLSFGASAKTYIGAGVEELAAIRYDVGPKLSLDIYKNSCQLGVRLEDSAYLAAFGFTDELFGTKRNIFGPYQIPPCLAMDPIVGDWASSNGAWRIDQTTDTTFTATIMEAVVFGDCVALPVGSQRTITKTLAGYETTFQGFDTANCTVEDTDQQAVITVVGDSMSWCGSGTTLSGCRSYAREGSASSDNRRANRRLPLG